MKKVLSILIIVNLFFSTAKPQNIRSISLQSGWKHQIGDSLDWKAPSFDDYQWLSILPNDYWDYLHDKDVDEYGWYRIKFFLPNEMKEKPF